MLASPCSPRQRSKAYALILLGCQLAVAACGGSPEAGQSPQTPDKAVVAPAPVAPPGSVLRKDVVSVVDAGLGSFLQRVRLEPHLQDGRFSGFRVVELLPPNFWEEVDLQAGDVVTQVNGQSIEYPNTAFEVFESLREAKEIRVVFSRGGERRQIVYPIVGTAEPKRQREG